ncbi:MAG: DUF6290 family protein [Desulfonauticus sp.]|nr:DUF6290 family protein [Desulfonauticus sp.]
MSTTTVTLSKPLDVRLSRLAQATKKSKSYFIQEALERVIEDLEDAYLAEKEYEEFLKSGEEAIPIEEMEKKLGLAD